MRRLALLLVALLAGCTSEPAGAPLVVGINAAPPRDVLPDAAMLPAGFREGISASQKDSFPHLLDGHSRIFERNSPAERQRVAVGALLFESPERAQEAFERLRGPSGGGMTPVALGDDAVWQEETYPAEHGGGGSVTLLVRQGSYTFWVASESHGAPPAVDVSALAREMVERAR